MTYTNDQRFQSMHSDSTDEWSLKIESPQPRDSGVYECQVSTEPKISQAFRLTVVGMFKLILKLLFLLFFFTIFIPCMLEYIFLAFSFQSFFNKKVSLIHPYNFFRA